jgi:hypothetical protein
MLLTSTSPGGRSIFAHRMSVKIVQHLFVIGQVGIG